ncbi:MAG: class I SAM-dependent methyltransferase [Candidatus Pacebacteria bacterium]|nr:class I SAM-dependent methyltransferase [Candidatus Paceibacterota bacterium]
MITVGRTRIYWDETADEYHGSVRISCNDFHLGPLLPGARELDVLPKRLFGLQCLELGCGGAQNSVYLARQGAVCTALDASPGQLNHARSLAQQHDVNVHLLCGDLCDVPLAKGAQFDVVHSVFALPFVADQQRAVREATARVAPGGLFILATAHPVFTGEWIDLEGEKGLFLENYFLPKQDTRRTANGLGETRSQPLPISTIVEWLRENGLTIDNLLEPAPLPIPDMTAPDIQARVPYISPQWLELYGEMTKFPAAVIYTARRAA